MTTGPWTHEPRWPLGAAFAGVCHALSAEPFRPSESQQEEYCNCGYARGVCGRFPAGAPADAVRFSVTRENTLLYVLEKDHAPVEFGTMEFAAARGFAGARCEDALSNPILARQANAFLEIYRGLA